MKRITLAAMVAGIGLAAAPSNAATTVSQCGSGTANSATGCNITFADGVAGTFANPNVASLSFTDAYDFDVSSTGVLGLTLSSIASGKTSDIAFSSVSLTAPSGTITPLNLGSTGTVEFYSLANFAATAGQYVLTLTGTVAASPPSAAYSGTLSFAPATTAVVEPAAWGMMILGFGLVGEALRRRKTSVAFG